VSGFDLPEARRLLRAIPELAALHVLESTGSTNDDARRLAAAGAPEGTVVVADRPTAGRGRHGHRWHSPSGVGLYLSVLFRPAGSAADATRFTLLSAVAACEAAHAMGAGEVEIKWPNDLLWRGRKVAGTLAELRSTGGRIADLVVGTGFNVGQGEGEFPPHLAGLAASLRMAVGRTVDRERLLVAYLDRLLSGARLLRDGGWETVRETWVRLAPASSGRPVRVHPGGPAGAGGLDGFEAVTAGIDGTGALRVRDRKGDLHTLTLAEHVVPLERLEGLESPQGLEV
jgi:BirA family biotin operon repressor/biotin-[acetyl-CoA-carboxylase] ligase